MLGWFSIPRGVFNIGMPIGVFMGVGMPNIGVGRPPPPAPPPVVFTDNPVLT